MYTKYLSQLASSLQPIESMISTLQKTLYSIENSQENTDAYSTYRKNSEEFKNYVHAYFHEDSKFDVWTFFDQFEEIKEYISSFETIAEEEQDKDRFYALPSDGIILKARKLVKRFVLNLDWMFLSVRNKFRVLFKKEALPKKLWKHKIPRQQLAELVYFVRFLKYAEPIIEDILVFRHDVFQAIKEVDRQIENNLLVSNKWVENNFNQNLVELAQRLGAKKIEIEVNFKELHESLDLQYSELHDKVGTLEFPMRRIKTKKLNKKTSVIIKRQSKLFDNYNRRTFALFEHWRLIYDIRFSNLNLTKAFDKHEVQLQKLLEKLLVTADTSFVSILESALVKIENEIQIQEVQDNLLSKKLLKEQIPNFMDKLMETDFAPHFDHLIETCNQEFEGVKSSYLLPSKKSWDKDVKLPKLRETHVGEIVSGCLNESVEMPVLQQKEDFVAGIRKSISNANELSGVVEYAMEYYNAKDVEHADNQHSEFVDGIERAVHKAKENELFNRELMKNVVDQFNQIDRLFMEEITGAITPDTLNQKQSEMIRKKRIRDAKKMVLRGQAFAKDNTKKAYLGILALIHGVRLKYSAYREVLGLSEKSESIGSELANYLSETEIVVGKLPLMYQRLFKIAPLTNAKYRIERPHVIHQLEIAYSNWTSRKFAPTCLVGEMGSGITSMINVFEEQFGHQYPVTRISLDHKIDGEESFIQFLKTIFTDLKFETVDDLILRIKEKEGRRIIIIENLHQLFLRKMHGFKNLMQFFRLISQTNSQIFWLSTCLLYTYKYLDYTLKMNTYYGYVVSLDRLDKDQLTEIIIKRHKFSGFKLNFIPPKDFHPKRSYRRMSESEKQAYLEVDYFHRLYKFAQSNLSLALVFWMRSVVRVDENNFYLQYKHLEYSFFSTLSTAQIVTLHALILHGSLLLKEHADIFSWDEEESFSHLMVFTDDGILVEKNGRYSINPLIYRLVVNHLSLLNYIH
ncbi:hypothetical protein [Labilibaculum sp.]|uniref:hypothetical protein n=1 Tax=Labilibaculum sp. TaxID=2060723 RepID=UPI003569D5A7